MEYLFITLKFFTPRQFEQLSDNTERLHMCLTFVHYVTKIHHSKIDGC
jgi:hypothetical protein